VLVGVAASSTFLLFFGCSSGDAPEAASSSATQALSSSGLVISAVYGGGGNAGATFANDFIELFNAGTSPVSLAGLSYQYAAYNADFASPVALPSVTLAPGRYFLIAGAGGGSGAALPAADLTETTNLAATHGKVAIASTTTALACGGATRCNTASIVDMIGYGGDATDYEGTATAALTATTAAVRKGAGCTDTNVNAADFAIANPPTAPRNQATPAAPCGGGSDAGADAATDTGTTSDTGADTSTGSSGGGGRDAGPTPPAEDGGSGSPPVGGGSSGSSGTSGSSGSSGTGGVIGTNPVPDTGGVDTGGCSASGRGGASRGGLGVAFAILGLARLRRRRRGA
jgi:uncharacterized protein